MKIKNIFFDLDGTLSDSAEGIINCATLALEYFKLPIPKREEMQVFIGPPLRDTFVKFGVDKAQAEKAVEVYRSRYVPIGMYETKLYSGVKEMLKELKSKGYNLYVATSKPEEMSVKIMQYLGIYEYFDLVCGATLDKSRDSKADVIAYLLEKIKVKNAIMVGDTAFDVVGANEHGIKTVGVSWGYGNVEEMLKCGAVQIADTTEELVKILEKF